MYSDAVTEARPTVGGFAADLDALNDPAAISAYLKEWRGRLNSPAGLRDAGSALMQQNSALIDAVLHRLFAISVARSVQDSTCGGASSHEPAMAIIATGGYGRQEMAPYSDVDVTFIPEREDDDRLNAVIKDMFQLVMDVFLYGADIKVGYAYRPIGELEQLDHQTRTALLDARFLCGDQELFKGFRALFRSQLLTADFVFRKWSERQAVLEKLGGDNVYSLEPNVKEGAGGLREIQTAEWIGEVRYKAGFTRVWPTLVERGIVGAADADAILESREFLLGVRNAVHIVSKDARDAMTMEKQEQVAALFGYEETEAVPAVETFMRDYYRHAARARRVARRAVQRCLDSEMPLGLGLSSVDRALHLMDFGAASADSALPLHAAELAQAYSLKMSADVEEFISAFLKERPSPEDPAYAGRIFTRLLAVGKDIANVLEYLEEQGVLSWLIPEFGPLMTLIPYDAAHNYTVGAHSLRVVRNLEMLRSETDPKLGDYRRVAGEISLPEVLTMAGLIHDIGKQWDGSHAETGAVAAAAIADRFGWDAERREKLVFLVRQHLVMAETSRLRDLSLEETVRDFARRVPDMDSLNMLYLLTYADTNAVGPGVWTDVQGKFLTELYYRTEAVLSGSIDTGDAPAYVPNLARQRDRIRKQLAEHNLPIDLIHEHTRNLPAHYLLNTPLEEMYLHIAMVGRLRETYQPIVDFKNEYGTAYTEMVLCTFDDPLPGLLAKITGVLYAHDINVHIAQVFTREGSIGIAIDTLWVDYRGRQLPVAKRAEVQEGLRKVLLGEMTIDDLLHKCNKPLKEQAIYSAKIDDVSSERFSVLEVTAPDEKGVLFRLASAISKLGWDIHAARLSAWGSRARDAFYVTDQRGGKVPAEDVSRIAELLPSLTFSRRKQPVVKRGK
jgi:[protein-PII] uridylyltransferase